VSHSADSFEVRYAPFRLVLLALSSLAFVSIGLWFIGAFGADHPEGLISVVIGWSSIGFFGACGLIIIRRIADRRVIIRIDDHGFKSVLWSDDMIPWRDVVAVHAVAIQGQKMLGIELRDPTDYPGRGLAGRLAGANHAMTGFDAIWLSTTGTDRRYEQLVDAVMRHAPPTSTRDLSC